MGLGEVFYGDSCGSGDLALVTSKMQQVLDVSGGAVGIAVFPSEDFKAPVGGDVANALDGLLANGLVAHDTTFSNAFTSGFKLWLHKRDDFTVGLNEGRDVGKDFIQPDEGTIDHTELKERRDIFGMDVADVCSLHHNDARVIAKLPGKLPVADVHRMNRRRAALEKTVGKTAGRGANIDAAFAFRVDLEGDESLFEFESPTRDELQGFSAEF